MLMFIPTDFCSTEPWLGKPLLAVGGGQSRGSLLIKVLKVMDFLVLISKWDIYIFSF